MRSRTVGATKEGKLGKKHEPDDEVEDDDDRNGLREGESATIGSVL